jgi:putative ABC transport system ATP-binding protein
VTTTPLLDVTGLQKSFLSPEGESTLIVDVPQFQLAEGEQVAVRGASGSGKTTFLNLIAGILQADKGTIVLAGQTMTSLSESGRDRVRAKTIGYVFQNFNLLQGYTAIENVMLGMLFGSGVDRTRAQQLLERVGLSHRVNYRPSQLSIGQQQRVAVARALANRPKLVLADEPTGNLDQRHAGEALELIREACRENGAALLLVSHDPAVLALFDRSEDLADLNQAAAAHAVSASGGHR